MRPALEAALAASAAEFTEIRFRRRRGTRLSFRGPDREFAVRVEQAEGHVRCLCRGGVWATTRFHDPGQARHAVRQAAELSLALGRRRPAEVAPVPARRASILCDPARDPAAIPLGQRATLLQRMGQGLLVTDRRVVEVRLRYEDRVDDTYLLSSDGLVLREERPELTLAVLLVAAGDGAVVRVADSFAGAGSWSELETWAGATPRLAERAVARLQAASLRPGRYSVVLGPRFAGLWAHRALGHRCEADLTADTGALLEPGARIGPACLNVGDDGSVPELRGTRAFDDEGSEPRNTMLVRNGVLVQHVHTRATAQASGVAPTGNARVDATGLPQARLSNTYIANGSGTLDDLLRGTGEGVYLAEPETALMDGGQVALRAGAGWMIRGGALAEPVKGLVLRGDGLGLFGQVEAVAGDFEWDRSASRCEHGDRTAVPVSTGAPHLRLVDVPLGDVE